MSFHVPFFGLLNQSGSGGGGPGGGGPGPGQGGGDDAPFILTVGEGDTFFQNPTNPYTDYGYFGFRVGAPVQTEAGALSPSNYFGTEIDSFYLSGLSDISGNGNFASNSIVLRYEPGTPADGTLTVWHDGTTYNLQAINPGVSEQFETTGFLDGPLQNPEYWTSNSPLTFYLNGDPAPDPLNGFDEDFNESWNT